MKLEKIISVFLVAIVLLTFSSDAAAQFDSKLSGTFGDKNSQSGNDIIEQFLRLQEGKKLNSTPKSASVTKFKPAGNSGVAESLADALGQDAAQKTALTQAFEQIKQAYEAEVAKEGKSNDLAAAMTFFISANVMTYYQTDPPSDQITDEIFKDLQASMASVPTFAEMTDAEKQKMHDWLVSMGGFAMTNYMDAKQSGDRQALANIKTFADYALRLVLGVEASKLNVSANGLDIQSDAPVSSAAPASANNKITGTWRRKSSSPSLNLITNAGYYVAEYVFNTDGTYTFKSEMWQGYLRSEEWWTTEESGSFSVGENSLTVSPRKSVATLRHRSGKVLKTQNNSLEPISFGWRFQYQEGIKETILILQPSGKSERYGGFNGFGDFPNAYVFDQNSVIEWKF